MNRRLALQLIVLEVVFVLSGFSQGTAFQYQGRLGDGGVAANGHYDFRFAVYNAVTNGTRVSAWITNAATPVTNGLFQVTLDFGAGLFTGGNYWLDLAVQTNGGAGFSGLSPRQPILPVPYAIFSSGASNLLGSVPAGLLTGSYTNTVSFTNGTNTFTGTFFGNGASVTNLNGSQISFGTVADARLSTNVALLNANQTFGGSNVFTGNNQFSGNNQLTGNNTFSGTNFYSGANTFTNRGNSFVGSFFGNGLVGWIPVTGTTTQTMANAGYLLLNSGLSTVTLPASDQSLLIGDIVRISGGGVGGWMVAPNSGQSIFGKFFSYRGSAIQPSAVGGDWRHLASSSDGSRMYAGGNLANGVYASLDSGKTWTTTGISGSIPYSVACSENGSVIYAAGFNGLVYRSTDYGASWISISASAAWNDIACSANGSNIIAGASSGALSLTTGTSPANGNWTTVTCSANFTNLAAAIGSTVYASTNGGVNWPVTSLPGVCNSLVASASGYKLVAAYNGGVAVSTNFGMTWSLVGPAAGNWTALAASADCTRIVAGVSNGLLYASANFGGSWTAITTNAQLWSSTACSADGTAFVAATRSVGANVGNLYYGITGTQTLTTNTITGSQGSAVELQYIGNGRFMPISSAGSLWSN